MPGGHGWLDKALRGSPQPVPTLSAEGDAELSVVEVSSSGTVGGRYSGGGCGSGPSSARATPISRMIKGGGIIGGRNSLRMSAAASPRSTLNSAIGGSSPARDEPSAQRPKTLPGRFGRRVSA